MSQEEVHKIIEELGGKATTEEIRKMAKKKFPDYTTYKYVCRNLRKLEKWGYIERIEENSERSWKIIEDYGPLERI